MTNKEAIAILTHNWKYRELIDNSYQYEALDHAINALRIVESIDLSFKHDNTLNIDIYCWEDIKQIIKER